MGAMSVEGYILRARTHSRVPCVGLALRVIAMARYHDPSIVIISEGA